MATIRIETRTSANGTQRLSGNLAFIEARGAIQTIFNIDTRDGYTSDIYLSSVFNEPTVSFIVDVSQAHVTSPLGPPLVVSAKALLDSRVIYYKYTYRVNADRLAPVIAGATLVASSNLEDGFDTLPKDYRGYRWYYYVAPIDVVTHYVPSFVQKPDTMLLILGIAVNTATNTENFHAYEYNTRSSLL
jgi:hypothetical protein